MFPRDLQEGYFFCNRGSKYLSGVRARRATRCGYWKSTGKDKAVHGRDGRLVGRRKTLALSSGATRPGAMRLGGRAAQRALLGGPRHGARRRRARLGTVRLFF